MSDTTDRDGPAVESRRERLVRYLQYNWSRMAVDATVLVAWLFVTTAVFRWFALPQWLLYVVVFGGIIVYSRITPSWKRPYRSPDS